MTTLRHRLHILATMAVMMRMPIVIIMPRMVVRKACEVLGCTAGRQ